MKLYSKNEVIDYVWQYSRFYGNKLGDCENYFLNGEGYVALVLLFEVTENICKSVVGNYDDNFNVIVKRLKDEGKISKEEEGFLSTDKASIRKIRNLFAHANLTSLHIVQEENGREIFYPLTEEDSCLLLYEKISEYLFNLLLKIIANDFMAEIEVDLGDCLNSFQLRIDTLSSKEMLRLLGFPEDYFEGCEDEIREADLQRLANNSANVHILTEIFKNLKE